jgi:hypothetical protein
MVDHRGEKPDDRQGLGALARSIVDSNLYLTLATADAEGRGEELEGDELERAIRTYSHRSEATGLAAWGAAVVTAPARHRLYHATASTHFLLGGDDERIEAIP